MPVSDSARTCWIAAAVMGLLVWIFTAGFGELRWFEGLFLALMAGWLLGSALVWISCRGQQVMDGDAWQPDLPRDLPQPGREPAPVAEEPVTRAAAPVETPEVAAPQAQVDDLKQIKGIGPKLEEVLRAEGVTGFAQIAAWDEAEIDRFAERLGRLGRRIRSDDWVGQARALVAAQKGGAA